MPDLYIIAGPNGAGKTTAAEFLLPQVFDTGIFINVDNIAAKLNPRNPESVAFRAGRIMLEEIQTALNAKKTFAIETTLATKSYIGLIKQAQLLGYDTGLYFFYLPSVQLAKERVKLRISEGGHSIPEDVIERRYFAGIRNLFGYILRVNDWRIYKNDLIPPELIAEGEMDRVSKIYNLALWEKLRTT